MCRIVGWDGGGVGGGRRGNGKVSPGFTKREMGQILTVIGCGCSGGRVGWEEDRRGGVGNKRTIWSLIVTIVLLLCDARIVRRVGILANILISVRVLERPPERESKSAVLSRDTDIVISEGSETVGYICEFKSSGARIAEKAGIENWGRRRLWGECGEPKALLHMHSDAKFIYSKICISRSGTTERDDARKCMHRRYSLNGNDRYDGVLNSGERCPSVRDGSKDGAREG